ncbi:DUF6325 family protein [Cellulomonas sp. SLBN-39]|uniref:DUF6325 family protein n=1 Tax=Cellulomonas sp. SLBN-39 TaxID=2768446 RepID=UPI0011502DF2|nr:DUF6325 family protein [Cellulomonas sp. SLBN-39]TQL01829.1 hypothetical protein FBY24_0889 [Cellulomonas sp. SLBN-39]
MAATSEGGPAAGAGLGPVEMVALAFPGERVPPGVVDEVAALVAQGRIRLVDAVVLRRGLDGTSTVLEVREIEDPTGSLAVVVGGLVGEGLTSEEDLADVAGDVAPGSVVVVLVVEHVWSTALARATRAADGIMLASERIPAEVVNELVAAGT